MAKSVSFKRHIRKSVLIALEDTKSSKYYLQALTKDKRIALQVEYAKHRGSDPRNVLKAIEKHKTNMSFEQKWIVIDRDEHQQENFNSTLVQANKMGVKVAYSNECYELWLLLHFKEVTRHITRHEIRRQLDQEFIKAFNCTYKKHEKDVYGMLIDRQNMAISRAKKLINKLDKDGELDPYNTTNNPPTTMYKLIEYLNAL
ncbi:hypothetical protein THERMOT_2280 [Bathymodiolus thermophilus thioautotrophic gill symbiont]|uniref:RloB family protein n=1 Tax=Bathymodiolus thermophilus thioautotrophic gill symbiont TaxID=2360 RepID=UPI00192C92BE|nr:RloB family protein [Bathymodiolus thermophilus thioautotrophic gill symbiont]CAB5506145.1 hypothetical protein THERMOT_2280 [Bathymodiolus thermophilus thioautotrophic gill symbiont]